jgi:hypothetical protein
MGWQNTIPPLQSSSLSTENKGAYKLHDTGAEELF